MFPVRKGDIIFNAEQTKRLLTEGSLKNASKKRGTAYANGTNYSSKGFAFASGSDKSKEPEKFDWISQIIERLEKAIDKFEKKATSAFSNWDERNSNLVQQMGKVTEQLALYQKSIARYEQEANSVGLSEEWKSKVKNGSVDISTVSDEGLAKKINDYKKWWEAAEKLSDSIDDIKEKQKELQKQKFDNIVERYEGLTRAVEHEKDMLEGYIDQFETRSWAISTNFYDALQQNQSVMIGRLVAEREELKASLKEGMVSGNITKNSQAWNEMTEEINKTTRSIQKASVSLEEYKSKAREVKWDNFDFARDRVSDMVDETDFLLDLLKLKNEEIYDESGKFTEEGLAQVGVHAIRFNAYMAEADKYASEIKRLNEEIANDPYDQELIKRRAELLKLQRENIINAQEEKKAVVEYTEDGLKKQLDVMSKLVDKYKDSLDASSDLYDYQKRVKDQTREILSLEKQMTAYRSDNSEESRAKRQRISVDLEKAKENLRETEFNKYISVQKDMLDTLMESYEESVDNQTKQIEQRFVDLIETTNGNSSQIRDTIYSSTKDVGYALSSDFTSIINSQSMLVSNYSERFIDGNNAVVTTITNMDNRMSGLLSTLNSMASDYIASVKQDNAVNSPEANASPPPPPPPPITPPKGGGGKPTVGGKITLNAGTGSYYTAANAANRTDKRGTTAAGEYTIYKIGDNGMINITKRPGTPGSWININDANFSVDGATSNNGGQAGASFFIPKKYTGNKSALNKEHSIVDRLEYFDIQAYGGVLEKYYKGMGFTDTYTGSSSQHQAMLAWINIVVHVKCFKLTGSSLELYLPSIHSDVCVATSN